MWNTWSDYCQNLTQICGGIPVKIFEKLPTEISGGFPAGINSGILTEIVKGIRGEVGERYLKKSLKK